MSYGIRASNSVVRDNSVHALGEVYHFIYIMDPMLIQIHSWGGIPETVLLLVMVISM